MANSVFRILSIAAGLALMASQGFLLYQIRAIAAWRVPILPIFFISSGLASGGGIVLLISGLTRSQLQLTTVPIVGGALGANLVIWLFYLYWLCKVGTRDPKERLGRPIAPIITVGLGHVFPLIVLFLMAVRDHSELDGPFLLEAVSGFAILLGVVFQKTAIIAKVSQLKPITIAVAENLAGC